MGCEIRIENVELKVDLILFELDELDMIIRMVLHQVSCSVGLLQ